MKVLVDTCVWSEALRKSPRPVSAPLIEELKEIIQEQRVALLGTVRQEVLSGISHKNQFESLRERLRAFDDYPLTMDDYERAAEFFNRCRAKGIQGSNTDFLICSAAVGHDLAIFSTDKDFENYAKRLPLRLHKTRTL